MFEFEVFFLEGNRKVVIFATIYYPSYYEQILHLLFA